MGQRPRDCSKVDPRLLHPWLLPFFVYPSCSLYSSIVIDNEHVRSMSVNSGFDLVVLIQHSVQTITL